MRKILCLLIFCLNFQLNQAQIHFHLTKTRVVIGGEDRKDSLHRIANEFSNDVGRILKDFYPVRVSSVMVKLETVKSGSSTGIKLIYEAEIEECDSIRAHYYFDHRGALSIKAREEDAAQDSEERAIKQKEEAKKEFINMYGSCAVICQNTAWVKKGDKVWEINEFFIVSPKKLKDGNH